MWPRWAGGPPSSAVLRRAWPRPCKTSGASARPSRRAGRGVGLASGVFPKASQTGECLAIAPYCPSDASVFGWRVDSESRPCWKPSKYTLAATQCIPHRHLASGRIGSLRQVKALRRGRGKKALQTTNHQFLAWGALMDKSREQLGSLAIAGKCRTVQAKHVCSLAAFWQCNSSSCLHSSCAISRLVLAVTTHKPETRCQLPVVACCLLACNVQ